MWRTFALLLAAALLGAAACSPAQPPPAPSGDDGAARPPGSPAPAPPAVVAQPAPTVDQPPPRPPGPPGPEPVAAFADPDTLGDALVAAEVAIRSPATPPDRLAASAWAQQQAYRDLVVHPDWRQAVRARLPQSLHGAYDANLRAAEALHALVRPQPQLPRWHIAAPPPAPELRAHYVAAEAEFGVSWTYLAAIHLVESRMGRIRGTSSAGARGPMQFLPSTWAAYGEGDIDDPRDAIRAAGRYLVAHGAPGNMRRALYAYNRSDRYVRAVEAYASVMHADERAFLGYYHWRVYYRTVGGDVVLPEGYRA